MQYALTPVISNTPHTDKIYTCIVYYSTASILIFLALFDRVLGFIAVVMDLIMICWQIWNMRKAEILSASMLKMKLQNAVW